MDHTACSGSGGARSPGSCGWLSLGQDGKVARTVRRGAARPRPIAVSHSGRRVRTDRLQVDEAAPQGQCRRCSTGDTCRRGRCARRRSRLGPRRCTSRLVRTIRYRKARHSGLNPSRAVRPVRAGVGYEAHRDRAVARVRAVSLPTLLAPLDHVALIDDDIRGAEADAIEPAADLLDAKGTRAYVATHDRDNEHRVRPSSTPSAGEVWDYPCGRRVRHTVGPYPV